MLNSTTKRIPWLQLALEAVLIMLSVLVALGVNEWRQDRKDFALAQQALETLRGEMQVNQAEVEQKLAYHNEVYGRVTEQPEQGGVSLRPAFLRNSAWETVQATGAVAQLDYEVAAAASAIHGMQQKYEQVVAIATELMYSTNLIPSGRTPGELRTAALPMLGDMIGYERTLLEIYGEALNLIETRIEA